MPKVKSGNAGRVKPSHLLYSRVCVWIRATWYCRQRLPHQSMILMMVPTILKISSPMTCKKENEGMKQGSPPPLTSLLHDPLIMEKSRKLHPTSLAFPIWYTCHLSKWHVYHMGKASEVGCNFSVKILLGDPCLVGTLVFEIPSILLLRRRLYLLLPFLFLLLRLLLLLLNDLLSFSFFSFIIVSLPFVFYFFSLGL